MKIFSPVLLSLGLVVLLVVGGVDYALGSSPRRAAVTAVPEQTSAAPTPVADDAPAAAGLAARVGQSAPALADQGASTAAPPSDSNGAAENPGGGGQRGQRMRQALAQLGLSDQQKQQIEQIRQTVTDRKERRSEIMNVLTPDQRAQLKGMWQAHRNHGSNNGAPAGGTPSST